MASYWALWKDYCDATIQSLVPSSLANSLPWTTTNSGVTDDLARITPYPHLPSEVILRILAFSLPAPSYTHAHERTRLLKQYALFSRDAARWATLLLRRDVACTSVEAATAFCRWIAGPAKRSRAALVVESVRYGTAGDEAGARGTMAARQDSMLAARHVANHCPNLHELWLSNVDSLELTVLRNARALRSLYLHETRLLPTRLDSDGRRNRVVFPHLATLHLSAIIASGSSPTDLLSPETLPALRHLDYVAVHPSQIPAAQQLQNAYQHNPAIPSSVTATLARLCPDPADHPLVSLAPQLSSLALGARATRTLPLATLTPFFARATHLTLLSLPLSTLVFVGFPSRCLPPSLVLLRLTREPERPTQLGPTVLYDRERGWRSSAFGFVVPSSASDSDDDEDDVPIEMRFEDGRARRRMYEEQRKEEEVRNGRERGVEELRHLGGRGRRYLVLPGGMSDGGREDDEYGGTGAELREVIRLEHGGEVVVFSEDPAHERKDGAFRLGTERWGRFVERPCADSLL